MAGSVLADAVWFHLRWNLICNFDCLSMVLEGFAVRYAFGMLLSLSSNLVSRCGWGDLPRCGWSSPVFGRFDLEPDTAEGGCAVVVEGAMLLWPRWMTQCSG
ncbi:hypothetical protein Nepgr_006534 [Nepenthes gracilis]|uniref:Uncharacterized protein n=1 Tax=Nepenthes gracilis TaxID=150966 RepID=A0AAD3XHF9_NEPGR|nr:hypothetical protein Nepgr_006534 [Nepenthes gracilis]